MPRSERVQAAGRSAYTTLDESSPCVRRAVPGASQRRQVWRRSTGQSHSPANPAARNPRSEAHCRQEVAETTSPVPRGALRSVPAMPRPIQPIRAAAVFRQPEAEPPAASLRPQFGRPVDCRRGPLARAPAPSCLLGARRRGWRDSAGLVGNSGRGTGCSGAPRSRSRAALVDPPRRTELRRGGALRHTTLGTRKICFFAGGLEERSARDSAKDRAKTDRRAPSVPEPVYWQA